MDVRLCRDCASWLAVHGLSGSMVMARHVKTNAVMSSPILRVIILIETHSLEYDRL